MKFINKLYELNWPFIFVMTLDLLFWFTLVYILVQIAE